MRKQGELNEVEVRILEAAKLVFFKKGFGSTKMLDIASEAGINPALLHYYFRSKKHLYDDVLQSAVFNLFSGILDAFNSEKPFLEKFELFIDRYIDTLIENPYVPLFILHEIQSNPERLKAVFLGFGANPNQVIEEIYEEIRKGTIAKIDPKELIMNMMSLCILPFAARPLFERIVFDSDNQAYDNFLMNRKAGVKQFIRNAIKPNNNFE